MGRPPLGGQRGPPNAPSPGGEELVRRAQPEGSAVTIVRVGRPIGNSKSGESRSNASARTPPPIKPVTSTDTPAQAPPGIHGIPPPGLRDGSGLSRRRSGPGDGGPTCADTPCRRGGAHRSTPTWPAHGWPQENRLADGGHRGPRARRTAAARHGTAAGRGRRPLRGPWPISVPRTPPGVGQAPAGGARVGELSTGNRARRGGRSRGHTTTAPLGEGVPSSGEPTG